MKNILLIFTGGTICSSPSADDGKNRSDAKNTACCLEEDFRRSGSLYADKINFVYRYLPQDILSENMTVGTWDILLDIFREKETRTEYDGIIVLHGTDTLAYTSALLSLVLAGYAVPVMLVSAQRDLKDTSTNGYINFRVAAELIVNGIAPNVYVVYRNVTGGRNGEGEMLVHYGSHLLQCPNYSDDFHSVDEMSVPDTENATLEGRPFETAGLYVDKITKLAQGVIAIQPHTGLCYDNVNLSDVRAIVHGTYHSESVCIGRAEDPEKVGRLALSDIKEEDRPYSVLSLLERCEEKGISVFLAPCSRDNFRYGTTANALYCGALPISDTTFETAYIKTLVGCSLGKTKKELERFLCGSINHEFIYRA